MAVFEVDKSNFHKVFPVFQINLQTCHFAAIDCEFSGLHGSTDDNHNSLFDTPSSRYKKMIDGAFKIVQFGITLFDFDVSKNEWHPTIYNFLIYPPAFEIGSLSEDILCNSSSLRFLREHNFDFNKWITHGIPYLNTQKEALVTRYLNNHRSILQTGTDADKSTIAFSSAYSRLNSSYTSLLGTKDIKEIVQDLQGFSHVIQALSQSKKLIIGHNCLTDIFLTYGQFYDDLPDSYETFKKKVHGLFPKVIDTKRLSFAVKDIMYELSTSPDDAAYYVELPDDTSLFAMHFSTQIKDKFSPRVIIPQDSAYKLVLEQSTKTRLDKIPDAPSHDAGFDSLISGILFIQLGYILHRPALQFSSLHGTAGELIFGTLRWLNLVNITRCSTAYINLAGADPQSHRPEIIEVIGHKAKDHHTDLLNLLNKKLAKFGNYDMKEKSGRFYIACGSIGCYRVLTKYLIEEGFELRTTKQWDTKTIIFSSVGAVTLVAGAVWWFCAKKD